jgi:TRAP-type uncharacterized transport system fused permease subunit
VAAAAFAAAAIAGSGPTITSVHATRFGIAGFTVGFAFIYDPGIMLRGSLVEIATVVVIQVAALTAVTAAYAGYLTAPMGIAMRVLLAIAGLIGAFGYFLSDEARLAVVVIGLVIPAAWQVMAQRRLAAS